MYGVTATARELRSTATQSRGRDVWTSGFFFCDYRGIDPAAHGGQKPFGWFGGPGLDTTGQALATLGFHPGRRRALMAGLVETGGGLCLALGFLTPLAAAVVFSVMLVAAVSAHVKQGFFLTRGGYEYTLVLGVAGLTAAFTGPGALTRDALLGYPVRGTLRGVAALFLTGWRRDPARSATAAPTQQPDMRSVP